MRGTGPTDGMEGMAHVPRPPMCQKQLPSISKWGIGSIMAHDFGHFESPDKTSPGCFGFSFLFARDLVA